jgi:hypothetical protein
MAEWLVEGMFIRIQLPSVAEIPGMTSRTHIFHDSIYAQD